jgi:putative addiction module component (TIGR02574 family)
MTLPDLQSEALKLSPRERARLAEALLQSLDELSEEQNTLLWIEESHRRSAELSAHPERARPADIVFRDARERLG